MFGYPICLRMPAELLELCRFAQTGKSPRRNHVPGALIVGCLTVNRPGSSDCGSEARIREPISQRGQRIEMLGVPNRLLINIREPSARRSAIAMARRSLKHRSRYLHRGHGRCRSGGGSKGKAGRPGTFRPVAVAARPTVSGHQHIPGTRAGYSWTATVQTASPCCVGLQPRIIPPSVEGRRHVPPSDINTSARAAANFSAISIKRLHWCAGHQDRHGPSTRPCLARASSGKSCGQGLCRGNSAMAAGASGSWISEPIENPHRSLQQMVRIFALIAPNRRLRPCLL